MYDPASGEREERRIGEAEVFDYFGVPPDKVVDVQALAGDSTDNVPGAPGIGVKTAAQLIAEYGDLETLLARAGEIKQPKRRETLTNPENIEMVRISKQLVTLVRDVELETPLDELGMPKLEGEKLIAFLKAMEFTTITRRVGEICGVDADAVEPDPAFVGAGGWRGRNGEAKDPPPAAPPRRRAPAPKAAGDADAARLAPRGRGGQVSRLRRRATRRARRPPTRAWVARAARPALSLRHRDLLARPAAGRPDRRFVRRGAGRGLLHSARPCAGEGDLFSGGGLVPGQIPEAQVSSG